MKTLFVIFFSIFSAAFASLIFFPAEKRLSYTNRNNPADEFSPNYQGYKTTGNAFTLAVINPVELTNGKTNIAWVLYHGIKPSFFKIGFTKKLTDLPWKTLTPDRLINITLTTTGTNDIYLNFRYFNGMETNSSIEVVYFPPSSTLNNDYVYTGGPTGYTNMIDVTGSTLTLTNTANGRLTNTLSTFSIGQYEVTYDLWYAVRIWATNNGYQFENQGNEGNSGTTGAVPTASKYRPVTSVNWRDCIVWCNAYSEMSGFLPCYTNSSGNTIKNSTHGNSNECDKAGVQTNSTGYRLPTEAEWQYAASYINGSIWTPHTYMSGQVGVGTEATNAVAWSMYNSSGTTNVGTRTANQLNIFDMSGNIDEWCWDWYEFTWPDGQKTNYSGPESGTQRIIRGGSYLLHGIFLQIGYRNKFNPDSILIGLQGFRLARSK